MASTSDRKRKGQRDEPEVAAQWVATSELKPWADNPRDNDGRPVEDLARSIERFGFGAPLLVRKADGTIIAGHTRLKAAELLGLDRVPVRYLDLSEADAALLALADNRIAELAEWSADLGPLLAELRDDGNELDGLGWDEDELAELLAPEPPAASGGDDDAPAVAPDQSDPDSELGVVYELGPHRLMCGDSMEPETWEKLEPELGDVVHMVTDPPYAIYGSATGVSSSIADDKMVRPMFLEVLRIAERILPDFGTGHVFCDWRSWPSWFEVAKRTTMTARNCLVWDKGTSGLGTSYMQCHELVGYFVKVPHSTAMKSNQKRGIVPIPAPNIKRHGRVTGDEREHNAQKPVALLVEILEKLAPGDLVEPFGGSGSTLIAAARTGRKCVAVEIDPKWCDVIRQRWTRYARENGLEVGTGGLDESES